MFNPGFSLLLRIDKKKNKQLLNAPTRQYFLLETTCESENRIKISGLKCEKIAHVQKKTNNDKRYELRLDSEKTKTFQNRI